MSSSAPPRRFQELELARYRAAMLVSELDGTHDELRALADRDATAL